MGQCMTGLPCSSQIAVKHFYLEEGKKKICFQGTYLSVIVSIYTLFYSQILILKKAAPGRETMLDTTSLLHISMQLIYYF